MTEHSRNDVKIEEEEKYAIVTFSLPQNLGFSINPADLHRFEKKTYFQSHFEGKAAQLISEWATQNVPTLTKDNFLGLYQKAMASYHEHELNHSKFTHSLW